jgi:thiol-disulfide isomerase/thioredoxin
MKRLPKISAVGSLIVLLGALLAPAGAQDLQINGVGIPNFDGATGWINSAPLTPDDLRNKVVLVDFFEYTCINCLRTLPYLKEWYKRYHKYGFEIISVQTNEFAFSGERNNVEAAAQRLGITWPIVIDANNAIWNRYHNTEWPHEYVFAPGEILKESFPGEGGYPDTEHLIQLILGIMHPGINLPPLMALLPQDSYDKPGAVCYPKTAEMLLGRQPIADASRFGSSATDSFYSDPGREYQDGAVYLQGPWHKTSEAVVSDGSNGYFTMRYHAIQVMVVMRPERGDVRVSVTQDGKPVPKSDAGPDVKYDASGSSYIDVNAARAYDVITNAQWGTHDLRLSPSGSGLGIYDVAFESCQVPGTR